MPSYDIIAISKATPTMDQMEKNRQSYVNGILIQSRGIENPTPCTVCSSYARPFDKCISIPGKWNNCCGNCKWREKANGCTGQIVGILRTTVEGERIVEVE